MLAKALSAKPGPWMKDALDVVMAWQLRNPDTATVEGAIEEVKNTKLHGELTASLIKHFLRLTIRPLFLKNHHPAVTAQGRKVTTTVLPKKLYMEHPDEVSKSWKGKDVDALDLLRWILQNIDAEAVEQNWPLLLPPVLSITDDTDTKFKAQGCRMISLLLEHTPSTLISRTGLASVFEDALMPCLGYLPTLTPEDNSVALLSEAYPALIALSRTMDDQEKKNSKSLDYVSPRIKLLDAIVRKGILTAYTYSSEHVRVTEILLRSLSLVVKELGIESVKHIKNILPMLSEVLSNPFGQAYSPTLLAAAKALQSVVLNGWPRMAFNRGEVLRGVTQCWLHIHGEESNELERLRMELKSVVSMLKDAVGPECDIQGEAAKLVEADSRLGELFS